MRLILILLFVVSVSLSGFASNDDASVTLIPNLGEHVGVSIDKNGNEYFTVYDNSTITIIDSDLSILKQIPVVSYDHRVCRRLSFTNGDSDRSIIATQHLFNDDDKWEYIGYGSTNSDHTKYWINIYNEDGELLYVLDDMYMYMVYYGDKQALLTPNNSSLSLISFNSERHSSQSLVELEEKAVKAYPNPVAENTDLKIELASEMEHDGSLRIIDSMGKVVYNQSVKSGDSLINVPAVNLRKGLYLYFVESDNEIIASDKLLVE